MLSSSLRIEYSPSVWQSSQVFLVAVWSQNLILWGGTSIFVLCGLGKASVQERCCCWESWTVREHNRKGKMLLWAAAGQWGSTVEGAVAAVRRSLLLFKNRWEEVCWWWWLCLFCFAFSYLSTCMTFIV